MRHAYYASFLLSLSPLHSFGVEQPESSGFTSATGGGSSRVDFSVDGLFSDDVDIVDSSLDFEKQFGTWAINGSIGHTYQSIDYEPFDFTNAASRSEDTYNFSLGAEVQLRSDLLLTSSISHTDGFADHRSLWISEFYDQENSFNPRYESADPKSTSFSLGVQWDYNATSSLAFTASYSQANIVAGWSREVDPVTGRPTLTSTDDELDTYSGSLRWETAINKRLKTQTTFRVSDTENRQLRTQLQSEWAYFLNESLFLRAQIGGAHENPGFEAIYGGLTVVYEITDNLQMDIGFRHYQDTGEISSSDFTPAAPGFTSEEVSLGLLWKRGDTSFRLSAALYDTDFDTITNLENRVFTNLYQDRDFVATRFAVTHKF